MLYLRSRYYRCCIRTAEIISTVYVKVDVVKRTGFRTHVCKHACLYAHKYVCMHACVLVCMAYCNSSFVCVPLSRTPRAQCCVTISWLRRGARRLRPWFHLLRAPGRLLVLVLDVRDRDGCGTCVGNYGGVVQALR